ncbi:hypothetical protein OE88DRAFT_1775855 [Heliocybe sulcata]|uniref:Uncharacterized protein n=1 Tax=Heliocybe sulcata TaxID=5364 RepID=A0A5C3MYB2_9AGAM|nr:hypothetical protein OE88DRAFT_1775855 [Heliocybe sulcata]
MSIRGVCVADYRGHKRGRCKTLSMKIYAFSFKAGVGDGQCGQYVSRDDALYLADPQESIRDVFRVAANIGQKMAFPCGIMKVFLKFEDNHKKPYRQGEISECSGMDEEQGRTLLLWWTCAYEGLRARDAQTVKQSIWQKMRVKAPRWYYSCDSIEADTILALVNADPVQWSCPLAVNVVTPGWYTLQYCPFLSRLVVVKEHDYICKRQLTPVSYAGPGT